MTTGTLQERMMTISRYFTREKWKNETGIFQYPRGKRRTDAVVEALEIAFEPTEFELKKELNLRGDDVVGNVYIVSVPAEDTFGGYFYLVLTCTDHVFVVQKLPEKATEMLNLVETEDTHAAASDNSATSDMVETSELSESEKTDIDSVKVANKNSEDVVASASEETEKVSENLEVLKKEVEDMLHFHPSSKREEEREKKRQVKRERVQLVIELAKEGRSQREIAKMSGTSQSTVCRILRDPDKALAPRKTTANKTEENQTRKKESDSKQRRNDETEKSTEKVNGEKEDKAKQKNLPCEKQVENDNTNGYENSPMINERKATDYSVVDEQDAGG